ncbi:MAG: hypothetical protein ACI9ON_003838 [Limisphaerales bacterium]|jgi:hypothetical protein
MNWDAIGAVGEVTGSVVVLVSFVYLALQVRQNTKQTKLAAVQAINASDDSAFDPIYSAGNTEVFARGQDSYVGLSDTEKMLFDMLMTRLIASFDSTTYQFNNDAYDSDLYWGKCRFYSTFISSPGGAEWLTVRKNSFSDSCLENLKAQSVTSK